MERYERIIALHRQLQAARRPVTVNHLQDQLGCSRATVYRDIAFLRDALMAPVIGSGEDGFSYDKHESERFELPGLWLNSEELHALLAAQQLLARSSGGMLSAALAPLQQRVEKLLDAHSGGKHWPMQRVRVIPHRGRNMDEHTFRIVASCVLERRRVTFDYRVPPTKKPAAQSARSG
jgi:predicted DNA-binding transcriptional regulator YafY